MKPCKDCLSPPKISSEYPWPGYSIACECHDGETSGDHCVGAETKEKAIKLWNDTWAKRESVC